MDRYPALKFLVTTNKVLAWLVAGFWVLVGILALVALKLVGFFILLLAILSAYLSWVFIRAWGELIEVWVRIEENTRGL
jgi:hypothetical protein